jgi:hypothetical protein
MHDDCTNCMCYIFLFLNCRYNRDFGRADSVLFAFSRALQISALHVLGRK